MSPINSYQRLLKTNFLLVQCLQTGFLMGLGDVLAQKVVEKKPYKVRRTVEFVFLGSCLVGPAVTVWYKYLQTHFGSEKTPITTLKKMTVDQLIFAPAFLIIFITSMGMLHKKDFKHIKKDLDNKYVDILMTNWKIWPAAQLINFYFMPLKYQILFVQTLAVFWNTYLTWKTSKD